MKSKFLRIVVIITAAGLALIVGWNLLTAHHRRKVQTAIGSYSGDGSISYIKPPPVPFAAFMDGVRIELPPFEMTKYEQTYNLIGIPPLKNYRVYLRWIGMNKYQDKIPGDYHLSIYNGDTIVKEYDSKLMTVKSTYTVENEYYFVEKNGLTGPIIPALNYGTDGRWRLRIKFSGANNLGKAQLIIRYGGEL